MLFKVAICDDENKEIQEIQRFLHIYEMQHDIDFEISTFRESSVLLKEYNTCGKYNILFLDVEMPGINGLELARHIREIPDKMVKIIFVSNYPEYMQDSFNVEAFQYFPKPLTFEKFEQLMLRIIKAYKESENTSFLIKEDGAEEIVYAENIISIESINAKRKRLRITLNDNAIEIQGVLSEWERNLANLSFFSPCRGFLVNLNSIHYIKDKELIMNNNDRVPLSRRKEKQLREIFSKRLLTINQIR